MPKQHCTHSASPTRRLMLARARLMTIIGAPRRRHRPRDSISVEVLITDRMRRRAIERELRGGLQRLQRLLAAPFPLDVAVVVQHVVVTDRQVAGSYQLAQRPEGGEFALVRLALRVDGRPLDTDELMAALSEQCIALVMQGCSPSLLVPFELDPRESHAAWRPTPMRPDPLAAHPPRAGERRA